MELLTNVDMLLIIEKGITSGIDHVAHRYIIGNNKYMKYYDPNPILMGWDVNNLYGQIMWWRLPLDGLEWKERKSKFTQKLYEVMMITVTKGTFLMLIIPSIYRRYIVIFYFFPWNNWYWQMQIGKLVCHMLDKNNTSFT